VSAEEDAADVARVLAGDVSAFEPIVRRWQRPLVNLAYRFCRDRGRAEDMAQDAFLRAYRALASWRKDAAFSTWLFALATNLYRSEVRRLPPLTASLDEGVAALDRRAAEPALDEERRDRMIRNAVL
jgi:RNA polymerase sigma-70 factor (ECF subfamily)